MTEYDVLLNGKTVGSAYVEEKGLYTYFQCRCSFPANGIYRVCVVNGSKNTDLGVCVPEGNLYVSSAKIPTKYLGDGAPTFYAISIGRGSVVFAPIEPSKSFRYIDKLMGAKFHVQAGQKGLLISN